MIARIQRPLARVPAAIWVLVVSGAVGFRLGSAAFADWQVAVETAQVIAGLVAYPPDNPFFIYHTKLWTVLHQVVALFLSAGVSEITASIVLSGAIGMVTFQALSLVVYALSRDVLLAIGAAFLIVFTRVAEFGVVYPIVLTGTSDTYGIVGLSTVVLLAALLGSGCYRTGGFLLGVLPALHLSLAVGFALCLILAMLCDRERFMQPLREAFPYLAAGLAFSVASLGMHVALRPVIAPLEAQEGVNYVSTFVTLWDAHRRPVDPYSTGVLLNVGALAIAIVWLRWFTRDLHPAALPMLWLIVVAGVVSLGFVLISWMPPERVPGALLVLMPARLLNFNAMIAAPLLLGLIAAYRRVPWSAVLAVLVGIGFVLNIRSPFRLEGAGVSIPAAMVMGLAALGLLAGAALWRTGWSGWERPGLRRAARVALLGVLLWAGWSAWQIRVPRQTVFADSTTDPVLYMASQQRTLLLTGGNLHLVQLRTRRPVLLDGGGLDALPYAPEAAPQMVRILRDVYAIDFFNPPEEARGIGMVPNGANHDAWQRFSRDDWRVIRRDYGVTQVLTYAQWALDLPVAARNAAHVLYDIPE